jgi:hypothetical protein
MLNDSGRDPRRTEVLHLKDSWRATNGTQLEVNAIGLGDGINKLDASNSLD